MPRSMSVLLAQGAQAEQNVNEQGEPSSDSASSAGSPLFLRLLGVGPPHTSTVMVHTAAWFLFGVFSASVVQQLGFIVGKTGGSSALVALVVTGPHVAAALAMLYVPWLERYRARLLVAVPRMFGAALLLLAGACGGPVCLAAVAVPALAVHQVGNVFYGRLLSQLYPLQSRGRMLSLPMFAQAVAMTGMSVVAGKALGSGEVAYRWFLPAGALIGTLAAALVLALPVRRETVARVRAGLWECVRGVCKNRLFLVWNLVYAITTTGFWLSHAAKPVYFTQVLGFDYWDNGIAIAVYNGVHCLGFLVWGRLLDRFRSIATMTVSWALLGAGALVMAQGLSFEWVLVGQCLSGIGMAGNNLAWYPVVLEFAPEDTIDRYMGFYMTVFGLRVLAGGLISGGLMQLEAVGSRHTLLIASVVMLLGSPCILALRGRAGAARPG